jgi:cytoskeletal protein CcmA (bactofilin family)
VWKKQQPEPNPTASPVAAPNRPAPRPTATIASIGPSISIKGDLSGEEDLVIEGHIQGEIKFHNHSVTVGRKGRVQADVYGKSICIEGQVFGNLWGQEEVVIRQTGKVEGNLTAPRVTLEDGSSFRGAIDMQSPQARAAKSQPPRNAAAEPAKPSAPPTPGAKPAVQAKQS